MAAIFFKIMIKTLKKNIKNAGVEFLNAVKKNTRLAMFAALPLEPITIKPMADIISGLNNALLALVAGLAILFLILGGIRYIKSWGDSDEMERAKKMVIFAVLGLVIILISYSAIVTLDAIING